MVRAARAKARIAPEIAMTDAAPRRYRARIAGGPGDMAAALALRAARFRGGAPDGDAFDAACDHVLVEDADGLAATFRTMTCPAGGALAGYSAQYYDLAALSRHDAPIVELGRFCTRPGAPDADVLRVAWGALARIVEAAGAGMLIGCSSFPGTDGAAHEAAFGRLAARHLAPARWAPGRRAAETLSLVAGAGDGPAAMRGMPPLLRTYLGLGGRVSDHAVVDRDLGRLHVFTGLEVAAIPAGRLRALRGLADA